MLEETFTQAVVPVFPNTQHFEGEDKQQINVEKSSDYSVIPIFPTSVYVSGDEFPIKGKLKKFISNEELGEYKNNLGNHISENTHVLERPELSKLKSFIQDNINTYAHEVMRIEEDCEFYMTQSWVNFNKKGMFHLNHTHYNSIISGVFYVSGGNCPITFNHSSMPRFGMGGGFEFKYKDYNLHNSQSWWLDNENGKVVIFPSHLQHNVEQNIHDETRISLSFNTFFRGRLGSERNLTELLMNNQFD